MTELPYERQATHGDPLPDGLCLEDQLMYLALRNLYKSHFKGEITRDQAATEKGKLLFEYDKRIRKREFDKKLSAHTVAMWKEMEALTSEYRKNRSIEIADKLVSAIEGKVKI